MTDEIYHKLFIQPVPNKNGMEIYLKDREYLTKNGVLYTNTNELDDLKRIEDNCIEYIFKEDDMHCTYKKNKKKIVIEVDTNIIFAINMLNEQIEQDCNQIPINLTGNYIIKIENCKIKLMKRWYDRNLYGENIILPNPPRDINVTEEDNMSMQELQFHHIKNLEYIDEIKINQKTTSNITYVLITFIIIIVITYLYVKLRIKKTINETIISLPPLPSENGQRSSSGGVMTKPTTSHSLPLQLL